MRCCGIYKAIPRLETGKVKTRAVNFYCGEPTCASDQCFCTQKNDGQLVRHSLVLAAEYVDNNIVSVEKDSHVDIISDEMFSKNLNEKDSCQDITDDIMFTIEKMSSIKVS